MANYLRQERRQQNYDALRAEGVLPPRDTYPRDTYPRIGFVKSIIGPKRRRFCAVCMGTALFRVDVEVDFVRIHDKQFDACDRHKHNAQALIATLE